MSVPPPRPTTSLEDQLCFALYSATNSVVRAYRPMLDRVGLTYPQYLIMLVLWHNGSQTVGEIAARMNLPPHTVSPTLDRMDKNGLLTRQRDLEDRRLVHVLLTDTGRELEQAVVQVQHDAVCATTLDGEELAFMRGMLREFVDRMAVAQLDSDT